ncbi:unnamed protein product [Closterium sp. Yama58-4]|nr:unnamed protein product [Closterium sp. Yama58-4]
MDHSSEVHSTWQSNSREEFGDYVLMVVFNCGSLTPPYSLLSYSRTSLTNTLSSFAFPCCSLLNPTFPCTQSCLVHSCRLPPGSMPNRAMPTHRPQSRRMRVHLSTAGENRPRCYACSVEGTREAKPNIL